MTGTTNDPFFKESKRIKRERMKWITIVVMTNIFTLLLAIPDSAPEVKRPSPWPSNWVEVSLDAEVLTKANGLTPVTVLNSKGHAIFTKAYLVSVNESTNLMIAPEDLIKLKSNDSYKVLPYSVELAKNNQNPKRVNYEIHF